MELQLQMETRRIREVENAKIRTEERAAARTEVERVLQEQQEFHARQVAAMRREQAESSPSAQHGGLLRRPERLP